MSYIGIDVGTSGLKAILLDDSYKIVNSVTYSYPVNYFNDGYSEQDPIEWYKAAIKAIKELSNNCKIEVKGISFSGQMHGLVLLDKYDNVIRPAILWNDQRTVKECEYLNNVVGKDVLRTETANIALTGYTLPKILWVKNNEPENFSKIDKVMLPKDYVSYMLSKSFASDVSDLSGTLLLDVKNRKYSERMIEISGLKVENLPKIYESNEIIGSLKCDELNFKNDVKIIIGGGDQAVGAVGTATVKNNQLNISLGTSGVVYAAQDKFTLPENEITHSFCDATGKYMLMGVALATGSSMNWLYEKILNKKDYSDLDKKLVDCIDNVYFLPYLSGERSPINDPFAKGAFLGLTTQSTQYDMINAVVLGTSCSLRQIFDSLDLNGEYDIKITGGGSKNSYWIQVISNLFNNKINTINIEEGPALGAAILAISGVEQIDVSSLCEKIINTKDIVNPQNDLSNYYRKFNAIYPAIKNLDM